MPWDTIELRRRFGRSENDAILRYLETQHPSAHSDVAEALTVVAHGLPGSAWFCPNPAAYAYVLLHTRAGIIYGLAQGMRNLIFKLPSAHVADAGKDQGQTRVEIGPEWIAFDAFRAGRPSAEGGLRRWCVAAFAAANDLHA